MILTVDIGNTNIALGGFRAVDEAVFFARLSTDTAKTDDEYAAAILSLLSLRGVAREEIDGAILSSVVPPLNIVLQRALTTLFGREALIVGPGVKTGLNIHCDNPSSVGADMICAAVAATRLYGSPALIVDLGTATKLIAIDARGTFIGAAIMPGIRMGLDALADGTAQLPRVSLEAPPSAIGKNTTDCMRAGLVFGHAAMLDGMIERMQAELGATLPVYATGGLAPLVLPHCRTPITPDEQMVLRGLYLIWEKNN